ncbi:hypothetical protein Scep_005602 [Stephania cephalantha]|uniref:Nematode resistance protein-like HSPRO2 n=1 Tax=Stephania cephalantha TaxID=152367 RepID=A0AAP0KUL0_9MAGN
MVDLEWKAAKSVTADMSGTTSPKLSTAAATTTKSSPETQPSSNSTHDPLRVTDHELSPASSSSCEAYDHYFRIPELAKLWSSRDFPNWHNEPIIKPALQALEITFRFVSLVLSDPRPYANQREWTRRLESLATSQVEIVALLCEDGEDDPATRGTAPVVDLSTETGVLGRDGSSAEVWKMDDGRGLAHRAVSRTSEGSLLPRLATWHKSEAVASRTMFAIESAMRRCPYTLGLGEPNLEGKPNLEYDLVCKPSDLHSLKRTSADLRRLCNNNYEDHALFTTHQILESWIFASRELLKRISNRIDRREFDKASSDCWLLDRTWKLLVEIFDLNLLMDPDDFLRLKNQLSIKAVTESESFCFRSRGLIELTKSSMDLKHRVPAILSVEVDPRGGPRIQEAAMKLYRGHRIEDKDKVHLLQAMQAIEASLKRFYFSYRQSVAIAMGSLEANGNRTLMISGDSSQSISRIFSEPTYFPSLDAAKTFLGDFWHCELLGGSNANGAEDCRGLMKIVN